jgi:ankyrin repeat protein
VNEDEMQGALVIAENWDVIRFLVKSGADLEIRDNCGQTPLAIAARIGDEKKAEILLELGADKYAQDEDGLTPRELAEQGKHKYVIELFK